MWDSTAFETEMRPFPSHEFVQLLEGEITITEGDGTTHQFKALELAGKSPIIYTNVLVNNWRPWNKLGIGCASSPRACHSSAYLDFPVSIGNYQYSHCRQARYTKGTAEQTRCPTLFGDK